VVPAAPHGRRMGGAHGGVSSQVSQAIPLGPPAKGAWSRSRTPPSIQATWEQGHTAGVEPSAAHADAPHGPRGADGGRTGACWPATDLRPEGRLQVF